MTKGILIAGNESSLSAAIAAEAAKRADRFAAAFIPNRLPYPLRDRIPPSPEGLIPLDWNPGSPVSARSLALAAENRLGQIDEAVLICTPPAVRKGAEDLNPVNVEIIIDDHIKGWFFLVKELALAFKKRRAGALALVLADIGGGGGREDTPDLIGPSVSSSFRSLAQGLMASSIGEPYQVYGFSASEAGEDNAFGAFIFKIIEDSGKRDAGKWHKFGNRLPFLNR
jgi:NAD(P)-dependent dehydrogenase (short-subunit alcohol dehydrogenase family)